MKGRPGKGQLTLIERQPDWRLPRTTIEIGERGVQKARKALAAHKPQEGKVEERLLAGMKRTYLGFVPASRAFPIDATIKDTPPRLAIHDFDSCIMRDLIMGGRVVGTLFSGDVRKNNVDSARHPHDHQNYQDVGFAAVFMS
jgi:hypothetical protein